MWPFFQWFRRAQWATLSQAPITAAKVARAVDEMLSRQYADAAVKDQEAWKWGPVASQVRGATRACEDILLPPPQANDVAAYFARVLPELAALAERYRHDDNDTDGYGLGTVREIEEGLLALSRPLETIRNNAR